MPILRGDAVINARLLLKNGKVFKHRRLIFQKNEHMDAMVGMVVWIGLVSRRRLLHSRRIIIHYGLCVIKVGTHSYSKKIIHYKATI